MADLQKEVDSAQRLMRSAQLQAREAVDEKSALTDKVDFKSNPTRLGSNAVLLHGHCLLFAAVCCVCFCLFFMHCWISVAAYAGLS